jgi:hypothetical protein
VAATSASNAWAVGYIGHGPGSSDDSTEPLIEHWDGTSWSQQTFSTPADGGELTSVTATSASNAWAVGWSGSQSDSNQIALIEHWNGSNWTTESDRTATYWGQTPLHAVTATSANSAWTVGNFDDSRDISKYYILQMLHTVSPPSANGSDEWWNLRAFNSTPHPGGDLFGVAVGTASNIWAVGQSENEDACDPTCVTRIEHYNGMSWRHVPSPNPPGSSLNVLYGIALANGHAWAVGTTDNEYILIEHWDGTTWTIASPG